MRKLGTRFNLTRSTGGGEEMSGGAAKPLCCIGVSLSLPRHPSVKESEGRIDWIRPSPGSGTGGGLSCMRREASRSGERMVGVNSKFLVRLFFLVANVHITDETHVMACLRPHQACDSPGGGPGGICMHGLTDACRPQ